MTDSKFESTLENKHGITMNYGKFTNTFYDKDKIPFHAKYDTKIEHDGGELYIDFKDSPLNTKTSTSSCQKKLFRQCQWHDLPIERLATINHDTLSGLLWSCGYPTDCLKYAWNHSRVKHSIIAKEYGDNYIVVFGKHSPTIPHRGKALPFQQYYKQRFGLRTMLLSEFKDQYLH